MAFSYGINPQKQRSLAAGVGTPLDHRNHAMTSPSPTAQHFNVEHLASFPQELKSSYITPADALTKLKNISTEGGLWAQKMNMHVSDSKVVMANEEQQVIEEYPMEQISLCVTVLDDPIFEHLLIFTTKLSKDKVGAVHLFQCKLNQASVISEVINRSREQKATRLLDGQVNGERPVYVQQPPSPQHYQQEQYAPVEMERTFSNTRTEMNLQQRHAVARAVEAFQTNQTTMEPNNQGGQMGANLNGQITPIQDAKITRDVQILNKCIEEIENFVVMLKRINEARKNLQNKKKKNKKKIENILILQSQPPPDEKIIDIYEKFKHALNLLGKLRQHISEPNAPELIHYLFIPLNIIVKVTGIDNARAVVDPLLTKTCVDLLVNCLDSREYHFWQSLGPNWTLTKEHDVFKDRYAKAYIPVFVDGWVPPEIITNDKQEAAARSTAAIFARMQNNHQTEVQSSPENRPQHLKLNTEELHLHQRTNSLDNRNVTTQQVLVGIVVYDYLAHNNKELTIRAGEKVYIIDNSRRWWLVRNDHGEQGYVPSTVLEIPAADGSVASVDSVDHASPRLSPASYGSNTSNSHHVTSNSHHVTQTSAQTTSYSGGTSPAYDSNQNYMNGNAFPSPNHNSKHSMQTVTPVVISVQLPDGGRVETNSDGTRIVATPGSVVAAEKLKKSSVTTSQTTTRNNVMHTPPSSDPRYAIVNKQTVSQQTSNGFSNNNNYHQQNGFTSINHQNTNGMDARKQTNQSNFQQQTSFHQKQRSIDRSPPQANMPPPPPPPPPIPMPVAPKPQTIVLPKDANLNSTHHVNGGTSTASGHGEVKGFDLQSELKNRLSLTQPEQKPYQASVASIDAVDVFIPLYKSSTADDVSRWLYKLGFSNRAIEILKGKTAKDLFRIKKNDMIELIGQEEGLQLYEELQVQNGAQTRHKTMTEFQRALYKRLQKREEQSVIAHSHHHGQDSEELEKHDLIRDIEDKSSAIKRQKEELERLKNGNRSPGNATFTSFSSAGTPQGKTKL